MGVVNPSYFGEITFEEPETVELACDGDPERKVTVTCSHGEWRPSERLSKFCRRISPCLWTATRAPTA